MMTESGPPGIRKRAEQSKDHTLSLATNRPTESIDGSLFYDKSHRFSDKDEKDTKKKDKDYRNEIFIATGLPFLVLLAFGGETSLYIMCFGAISSYIFDLLGSVEVIVIVILLPM